MSLLASVTTVFFKAVAHSPSTSNSSHTHCTSNNSCRRQSPPLECLLLLLPPPLPLKLLLVTLGPQRVLHTQGTTHYQLPWQPHQTTSLTTVSRSIKVATVTQTPPFQPVCPWPSPAVPSVEQPPSPSPPSASLTPLGAPAPVSGRERGGKRL